MRIKMTESQKEKMTEWFLSEIKEIINTLWKMDDSEIMFKRLASHMEDIKEAFCYTHANENKSVPHENTELDIKFFADINKVLTKYISPKSKIAGLMIRKVIDAVLTIYDIKWTGKLINKTSEQ